MKIGYRSENESSQEDRSGSYTGIGHPFVTVTDQKDRGRYSSQERELDSLVMEPPRTVEGIELVIRGDSMTIVDWINDKA